MASKPITFYAPFAVLAKQSVKRGRNRKTGKAQWYTPTHIKKNAKALQQWAEGHEPHEPFKGAVMASYQFYFATPRKKLWGTLKDTADDLDNLCKQVTDALQKAGWFAVGDGQVAGFSETHKYWAEADGVRVRVWQ